MTLTIGLLLFLLFAASDSIRAQQSDSPGNPLTINTDLVVTWAQVLDRKDGKVVNGLEIDDFTSREDGKPQQISRVKESEPLSVVIIGSSLACAINPPEWELPRILESLRQLGDDTEIALMSYLADVVLVQPLTKDHNVIADVINKGSRLLGPWVAQKVCKQTGNPDIDSPRPGEAIYQAARYLEKEASPGRRKIIIVLTDPPLINKTHFHTAAEVSEALEKTHTSVYVLFREYYGNSGSTPEAYQFNRKDKRRRSGGLIEDFVEQTGGTILVAKNPEQEDEMFLKLTGLIGQELSPSTETKAGKLNKPILAQQLDHPKNSLTIPTDLVVTWANILNKKDGSLVKGLSADDLLIREDGKPQQISIIKEDQPLSVVILVKGGWSGSWPPQWSFRRSLEALGQLGDDTEVALMAWEGDVVMMQSLTRFRPVIASQLADRNFFLNALSRKQPQYFENGVRYFPRPGEAVYQAAKYLEQSASPERRKIIIVLTYQDVWHWIHLHSAQEVKELLERTGTTVYALYQDNRAGGTSPAELPNQAYLVDWQEKNQRAGGTVEEFVEQTGGTILKGMPEEGDELLIKLMDLIRSAYTIGYYPENSVFDGRFRRIKLELSTRGKAKVGNVTIKTRNGYRALRPSAPAASEARPER